MEGTDESEWEELLHQAGQHGLKPLLYRRLEQAAPISDIPTTVFQDLRQTYLLSAKRNIRVYRELAAVLTSLREQDIPVIVLKGAHLAEVVYQNLALRPMADIDLLVHAGDLDPVQEWLLGAGYGPRRRPNVEVQRAYWHALHAFEKPNSASVDVHWTPVMLGGGFSVDVDGLWNRAQPASMNGVVTSVLACEDLLLHLCVHGGYQHAFGLGLRPVCDIAETLFRYRDALNWAAIVQRTRLWGAQKCVYFGLRLSQELLDAPVPQDVLESLAPDDDDGRWMKLILKQVFGDNGSICPSVSGSSKLAQLRGPQSFRHKVGFVLRRVFPARKELACIYRIPSDSLRIYPCYILRLRDLIKIYGPALWRTVRRDPETLVKVRRALDTGTLCNWLA
ncbi:nucleotidyltransferase family protein, partial [Planctomycetota bacterium]